MKPIMKIAALFVSLSMMIALLSACSGLFDPSDDGTTVEVSQSGDDPNSPQQSDSDLLAPVYSYSIVDTGQTLCYDDQQQTACPDSGQQFFGQDAQYAGFTPRYQDNGDGTVTDLVTGLMWQQDPGEKMTFDQAVDGVQSFNLANYEDWRLPTIKELYSLILFDGIDPSGFEGTDTSGMIAFINTDFFDFSYGNTGDGERIIDAQFASSTQYVSTTMNGAETMFGVNFADGRIKGYGTQALPGQTRGKLFYVLYVRGRSTYGTNDFVDNGDGTVSDLATGLMWMQSDSNASMLWGDALSYCEGFSFAGYEDWRLPDIKELQSIVDYSRSPETTQSAAIDSVFDASQITNEAGQSDYPFYWSSTTHANFRNGANAAYISFGRALGYMNASWMDVHGAGAQRSDPKTGNPSDYPTGHGPQGDAIRIYNYVRCVRGGAVTLDPDGDPSADRSMQVWGYGETQTNPSGIGSITHTPPQEAVDACVGLPENEPCSVITPGGSVMGSCAVIQDQLACIPPGGQDGSPPPGGNHP